MRSLFFLPKETEAMQRRTRETTVFESLQPQTQSHLSGDKSGPVTH